MNNATEFRAIKVTLHETHDILDQQIALRLHDGRRIGADKHNEKVVSRFGTARFIIVFKLGVVESDFKLSASC
jgi:hypothetical protein